MDFIAHSGSQLHAMEYIISETELHVHVMPETRMDALPHPSLFGSHNTLWNLNIVWQPENKYSSRQGNPPDVGNIKRYDS